MRVVRQKKWDTHQLVKRSVWAHQPLMWFIFSSLLLIVLLGLWGAPLPVSFKAFVRLQPGLFWGTVVFMLLIVLFALFGNRPDPESRVGVNSQNLSQPQEAEVFTETESFLWDFFVGGCILCLCIGFLFVENIVIGLFVKNSIEPDALSLFRASLRPAFLPEQLERARYITSVITFPIVCVSFWILSGRIPFRSIPRRRCLGVMAYISVTVIIGAWSYYSCSKDDFACFRTLFPDFNLSYAIGGLVILVILLAVEDWIPAVAWTRLLMRIGEAAVIAAAGVILFSTSLLFNADLDRAAMTHLNAYYYSIVQVAMGKTLLVDLANQYGFYPYFLEPVLQFTGLNISGLTAVAGILLVVFFSTIYFLLFRLAKSRLIALCTFIAIFGSWFSHTFSSIPFGIRDNYFQYWPHRVIIPGLLMLSAYFYQKGEGNHKKALYCLSFLVCGFGILWNIETGIISMITWLVFVGWEVLNTVSTREWRHAVRTFAFHVMIALLSILFAFGTLLLYTWIRSGTMLDIREIAFYQVLFYQYGYYMLPIPLVHPWNLVVLLYMVGICLCLWLLTKGARAGLPSDRLLDRSWPNMVFLVSIMGMGLFSSYQGRSHDLNLVLVIWPSFFLIGLFADALWKRFGQIRGSTWPTRAFKLSLLIMPLFLIFVLFLNTPHVLRNIPNLVNHIRSRIQMMSNSPQSTPQGNLTSKIEFMNNHFSPGEAVVIFSKEYQTVFYINTQTTNPVQAPSFDELVLESDIDKYYEYLGQTTQIKIIVSDEFYEYDAELYDYIMANFTEVDRADDLGVFVKKQG